MNKEDMI